MKSSLYAMTQNYSEYDRNKYKTTFKKYVLQNELAETVMEFGIFL